MQQDRADEVLTIVLAGGRGQLHSALTSLQKANMSDIPCVALSKQREECWAKTSPYPLPLPPHEAGCMLLRLCRDEAHALAVYYHRHVRSTAYLWSAFDNGGRDGVTLRERISLLRDLKNISAVRNASVSRLATVKSITFQRAKRIYEHMRSKPLTNPWLELRGLQNHTGQLLHTLKRGVYSLSPSVLESKQRAEHRAGAEPSGAEHNASGPWSQRLPNAVECLKGQGNHTGMHSAEAEDSMSDLGGQDVSFPGQRNAADNRAHPFTANDMFLSNPQQSEASTTYSRGQIENLLPEGRFCLGDSSQAVRMDIADHVQLLPSHDVLPWNASGQAVWITPGEQGVGAVLKETSDPLLQKVMALHTFDDLSNETNLSGSRGQQGAGAVETSVSVDGKERKRTAGGRRGWNRRRWKMERGTHVLRCVRACACVCLCA